MKNLLSLNYYNICCINITNQDLLLLDEIYNIKYLRSNLRQPNYKNYIENNIIINFFIDCLEKLNKFNQNIDGDFNSVSIKNIPINLINNQLGGIKY